MFMGRYLYLYIMCFLVVVLFVWAVLLVRMRIYFLVQVVLVIMGFDLSLLINTIQLSKHAV